MPRPSQYSAARRLVMQVTVFMIFLATLGLATLIGRTRDRAIAVTLADEPYVTPYLAMRLPAGWAEPARNARGLPVRVTTHNGDGVDRRLARAIVVYQTAVQTGTTAEQLLRASLAKVPGEPGNLRPFPLLGQAGVLARFEHIRPVADDPFGRSIEVPGWYAAGVVSHAGPDGKALGVVIGVEGFATAGPAGSRLVRQVADGLSLRRP